MLRTSLATLALALPSVLAADWAGAAYPDKYLYAFPLPVPAIKQPLYTSTNPNTGKPFEYYEIVIKPNDVQVYPDAGKTHIVGYDGGTPGPTFMMKKGVEAVVRFINQGEQPTSVHLHGSYSRAPFDGWAEDLTPVGSYKDYYYPNAQAARTLWYHDHAIDHTAHNAYYGLAGFYILHDEEEQNVPGLPQGYGKYDIPLALASKRYNADGSLWDPDANGETQNLFGDVIHVNGQPWPYLNVEPRKYRFRFLDTSISRAFQLYFETATGVRASFNVVGGDAGLALKPEPATQLEIAMAERYEVVFDFEPYKGQNVTLKNNRKVQADVDYLHTDKVMRFVVGQTVTDTSNNGALPDKIRDVDFPVAKTGVDRSYKFGHAGGGGWTINGITWEAGPEARVLAKPQRGATEVWELINDSGGWSHPIHIHLVDFQIISRIGGDRNSVLNQERSVLKDVIWLGRGETLKVIARYAPWDGLYMFHCHNLVHEDHAMMAAMNVTALTGLGYSEKTRFLDPMDNTYRAKPYPSDDYQKRNGDFSQENILKKLDYFSGLDAYASADKVNSALIDYWKTYTSGATTLVTSTIAPATSTVAPPATTAAPPVTSTKSDDPKGTKTTTTKATTTSKTKK